jgi:hypothetical protein
MIEPQQIPFAGLDPAIHAFPADARAVCNDVGGRTKSGHGGVKFAR